MSEEKPSCANCRFDCYWDTPYQAKGDYRCERWEKNEHLVGRVETGDHLSCLVMLIFLYLMLFGVLALIFNF